MNTPLPLLACGFASLDELREALQHLGVTVQPPLSATMRSNMEHRKPGGIHDGVHLDKNRPKPCACGNPPFHRWGSEWECERCYRMREHTEHRGRVEWIEGTEPRTMRVDTQWKRKIPIKRSDYPDTPEGLTQYRKEYSHLWHKTQCGAGIHKCDIGFNAVRKQQTT